jgi:hypothetical protein
MSQTLGPQLKNDLHLPAVHVELEITGILSIYERGMGHRLVIYPLTQKIAPLPGSLNILQLRVHSPWGSRSFIPPHVIFAIDVFAQDYVLKSVARLHWSNIT